MVDSAAVPLHVQQRGLCPAAQPRYHAVKGRPHGEDVSQGWKQPWSRPALRGPGRCRAIDLAK